MNGVFTGTLDRIVDDRTAVILIESGGEGVEQVGTPVNSLPENAQCEGSVLTVELADGEVDSVTDEPGETRDRCESAQDRLDRLSARFKDTG